MAREHTNTKLILDLNDAMERDCLRAFDAEHSTQRLLDDLLGHHEEGDFPGLTLDAVAPEYCFDAED